MMTRKDRDRRMDGYIRVSRRLGREGETYISPKIQREAIERWAEYKGVEIVEWHVDEDWSGGTQERPGLEAAIDRAIRGETGGIVSWKIDRFSRYTEGGLRDLRRLEEADARLVFVVEDVDTGGPMGKFVYTVMLAMAEYFLANIKAGWLAAKTRAINRGVHIGPCPAGYVRNEDGTLAIDPMRGPIITAAFGKAATTGVASAVRYLLANAPWRTWTTFTATRTLANRTYLGETSYGENLVRPNAHPALVDRGTFEAVRLRIEEETGHGRRRPRGDFPLSQLAACGTCGGYMVGARGGGDNRRMYRCAARCEQPAVVSAILLEDHVVSVLRDAFDHPGFRIGADDETAASERSLERAEAELDLFANDVTAREMLGVRYHQALQTRIDTVDEAREALRASLAASGSARVVVPADLWETLEPAELAEVLRAGLEAVIVRRGRLPIGERVRVVPKGVDSSVVPGPEDA